MKKNNFEVNSTFSPTTNLPDVRFLELIESLSKIAVQGYNRHREVIYWNKASTFLYGYTQTEALGKKLEDLIIPPSMKKDVIAAHKNWLEHNIPIPSSELTLQDIKSQPVPVFSSHVLLKTRGDEFEMFCLDIDISEQVSVRKALEKMVSYDPITNCLNRHSIELVINELIKSSIKDFSLLFIDIDRFKDVNDVFGYEAGDELLLKVSERLSTPLEKTDYIARFSADKFIVILSSEPSSNHEILTQLLIDSFNSPLKLHDQLIFTSISVGICHFPNDGNSVRTLLQCAETAMYDAKENGRNQFRVYNRAMSDSSHFQIEISQRLRESLIHEEFHLVYQPIYCAQSEKIVACEALLRWNSNANKNNTTPDTFIPIAEKVGLMIPIGNLILHMAFKELKKWRSSGIKDVRMLINISGKQLLQKEFFSQLSETLEMYELTPSDIGLELTEHALIEADDELLKNLSLLQVQGVDIAIDDFGTGYSSLSYLNKLPVNTLKIDKSFVDYAPYRNNDRAIFEAIVGVAHKLDLLVIAEGVETTQHVEYCKSKNVDMLQGYSYSKPLSSQVLESFLLPFKS